MILAYKVFGVGEFSARFFAAFFGVAAVLLVAWAGTAVLGPSTGSLAGLVLGVSFLFTVAARSATTDAFLLFFTNAAIIAGYFSSARKVWAVAAWGAMGFAVLAKGPVGVVLPLGALVLFRLADVREKGGIRAVMELFPPLGILLFVVIAAPWYALAALRTGGDLVSGFILKHNVGRYLSPMESHSGPVYYYLPVLLLGFYPWAAFLPQAVANGLRNKRFADRNPDFLKLQVIWAFVVLAFFSVSGTKLPNYILPAFPALAFLTAAWVEGVGDSTGTGFRGRSVSWMVSVLPGFLFPLFFWWVLEMRAPGYTSLALLAVPMAAASLGVVLHFRHWHLSKSFRCVAYITVAGLFALHALLLPRLEPLRMAPKLGKAIARHAGPEDAVASVGYNKPALYFYGKRPVVRAGDEESLRSFLSSTEGRFVVAPSTRFDRLSPDLRAGLKIVEKGLDALDTNQVVLVAERIDEKFLVPDTR
jgi:4-amino-4-deoxy-L-arabinose transferase-like glycosyltransferase